MAGDARRPVAPDLRHPVSLRGIDFWLDQTADMLTAYAEQPAEIRDIAHSVRITARAIRRDPEYAAPPPENPWIPSGTDGLPPDTYPAWRAQEISKRERQA